MPAPNTGFFNRMRRLFSSDMIIRDTGKGRYKTIDLKNIQSTGYVDKNSLVDRFSRVYQSFGGLSYGTNNASVMNLQRVQFYRDYDLMDKDAIVSSALDIIAAHSMLKNDENRVLKITSSDEDIKAILNNLFYDILDIEYNLKSWVRNLIKYGDTFLFLEIMKNAGIIRAYPMDNYAMNREDQLTENGFSTKFYFDPSSTMGLSSYSTRKEFDEFEIAHFRMQGDTMFLPYGKSLVENVRQTWKQYTMLKDAAMTHRITRSSDKRIFFVNVGNIPPADVDTFMQKMISSTKKEPLTDPVTGEYNLKFNMMNMLEDFYIPVRNGDESTKIDVAPGLNFTGMEDIQFFQGELFAGLKVPKAYLNYSDDIAGKVGLSQLDLVYSTMIEDIQKVLEQQLTIIAYKHLAALEYEDNNMVNFDLSLKNPSIVYEQEKIALWKEKMDLATQMMDSGLFSSDYIYENVFQMHEDEYDQERELVVEDRKHMFRLAQIENEGNDPMESGKSYGTPHDLATAYNNKLHVDQTEADAMMEPGVMGRPVEKASIYTTDDSMYGRDPLAKKNSNPQLDTTLQHDFKNGPMALTETQKKINIFNKKRTIAEQLKQYSMFSEKKIMNSEPEQLTD